MGNIEKTITKLQLFVWADWSTGKEIVHYEIQPPIEGIICSGKEHPQTIAQRVRTLIKNGYEISIIQDTDPQNKKYGNLTTSARKYFESVSPRQLSA